MVLIETNIHQSALRSESTSSEKKHIPPSCLGHDAMAEVSEWEQPPGRSQHCPSPLRCGAGTQPHPPAWGFPGEELAPAAEGWCGCSQPLSKFPQTGYSRPAVVFGYFRYIAEAQLFQGLYGDG